MRVLRSSTGSTCISIASELKIDRLTRHWSNAIRGHGTAPKRTLSVVSAKPKVLRDNQGENRIASPEMLPCADLLANLICSPPIVIGGGGHGADQHYTIVAGMLAIFPDAASLGLMEVGKRYGLLGGE
jgi:hypothetical protein